MKNNKVKIPVKYAIRSGAWFQCYSECEGEKKFRLRVLSFEKVNLAAVDNPEKLEKVSFNTDAGDWWILKLELVNLNKINEFLQYTIQIVDQDDFEFNEVGDGHLGCWSNYAIRSGLRDYYGHSFIPKIKHAGSLSYFLPKDNNAEHFISIREGTINEEEKVEVKKQDVVLIRSKAKKTIAVTSKGKKVLQKEITAQKPEKKVLAAKISTASKKGSAAFVPASDRFRRLKSMLLTKRAAVLREAKQEIAKYVRGEDRQLVDTAINKADWAAVESAEDISLRRLSAKRQLLDDVDEGLRKVDEGTYGICEGCAEEISEKRLRVIPTATLCIDCEERKE